MKKHLVVQYFDHYVDKRWYFETKEEAESFVKDKNKELKIRRYKVYVEYKGKQE